MNKLLKSRSIQLRRKETYTEKIIWNLLRNRRLSDYKFRRQYVIDPYIVDFICLHRKIIIEIDGDSHLHRINYDAKRTHYLESLGYKVLRFTNDEIFSNADDVLEMILTKLIIHQNRFGNQESNA